MSLDTSKAGQLVAEQMEAIENDYADQEGYELGAVITIVEVVGQDGSSNLRIRNNIGNLVTLLGALRMAEHNIIASGRQSDSG
jgi:hypothetical protein